MRNRDTVSALKRLKVETGSIVCLGCGYEHNCSTKGCRILREAADTIEELSRENESLADTVNKADEIIRSRGGKWISVEERLPECEPGAEVGNITFRLKSGTIYTGCFGRGGLQRDKYFRNWTDSGEGWDAEYVTHWVRLSDPEEVENDG